LTKEFGRCKIEIVNQIRNWLIHRKQDSLYSVGKAHKKVFLEKKNIINLLNYIYFDGQPTATRLCPLWYFSFQERL
jgi:hypothetical protein